MAVQQSEVNTTRFYRLYGLNGLSNEIDRLNDRIEELQKTYNIKSYQSQLTQQVQELKKKEEVIFSLFSDNITDAYSLEKAIVECKKNCEGLSKLSGPELWEFIAPAQIASDKTIKKEQLKFQTVIQQGLIDELNTPQTRTEIADWLTNYLNDSTNSTGRKRVRVSVKHIPTNNIEDLLYRNLTEAQKNRVDQIYNNTELKISEKTNTSIKATLSTDNWYDITGKGKTQKQLENLVPGRVKKMKEKLIEYLKNHGLTNEILIQTVDEVFSNKNNTIIAIGKDPINRISGILGEIQGLYIIRSILKPNSNATVDWVGGLNNPHEDLYINYNGKKYGIQIKNGIQDASLPNFNKTINFAERKDSNFFQLLDLNQSDWNDIAQIYQIKTFNIPYESYISGKGKKKEKKYREGENSIFQPYRENIELNALLMDKILSLFANVLLYMSTIETAKKWDNTIGNSLYLINGSKVYLASEMLLQILDEVDYNSESYDNHSFSISAHYNSKNVKNIVDYLNKSNKKTKKQNEIGSLIFTSSYNFH